MLFMCYMTVTKFPSDDAGVSARVRPRHGSGVPRNVHPGSRDWLHARQTVATEATRRDDRLQPPSGRLQARLRVPASLPCR